MKSADLHRWAAHWLRYCQPRRALVGIDQNFHPAPLMAVKSRFWKDVIFVAVGRALAVIVVAVAIVPRSSQGHLELNPFEHVHRLLAPPRHQAEKQHTGLMIGI